MSDEIQELVEDAREAAVCAKANELRCTAISGEWLNRVADALERLATTADEPSASDIDSMCLTLRHDFGLDRDAPDSFGHGMTHAERNALRAQMRQLVAHHWPRMTEHFALLQKFEAMRQELSEEQQAHDRAKEELADARKTIETLRMRINNDPYQK